MLFVWGSFAKGDCHAKVSTRTHTDCISHRLNKPFALRCSCLFFTWGGVARGMSTRQRQLELARAFSNDCIGHRLRKRRAEQGLCLQMGVNRIDGCVSHQLNKPRAEQAICFQMEGDRFSVFGVVSQGGRAKVPINKPLVFRWRSAGAS